MDRGTESDNSDSKKSNSFTLADSGEFVKAFELFDPGKKTSNASSEIGQRFELAKPDSKETNTPFNLDEFFGPRSGATDADRKLEEQPALTPFNIDEFFGPKAGSGTAADSHPKETEKAREVEEATPKAGSQDRLTDTVNSIKDIPAIHEQMVVVTTPYKESTTGTLRIYDRNTDGTWVDSGERIAVNVGRNGLSWSVDNGDLLDSEKVNGRRKVEGDGTGPIGLFTIEGGFGLKNSNAIESQLADHGAVPGDTMPYRQIVPGSQWVSTAENYNQWIDDGNHNYAVRENLHSIARSGPYEYGLVLGYNGADMFDGRTASNYPPGHAQYKGGSAIFGHVWKGPGVPTAGCTAMSRENMLHVMATLQRSQNPLWLQIPESELSKLESMRFQSRS
ncbi:hypothetical protein GC174_01665 [bacterium]|nr:hypothetical protein [bacterium]